MTMRANLRAILALALPLLGCQMAKTAAADPGALPWQGVWRGTVGNSAVQVCLQHGDDDSFGGYYYLRHLQVISLDPPAHAAGKDMITWTERTDDANPSAKGPVWHITAIKNGHLDGVWTDKGKSLPIALTAVPVEKDSDGEPCGSLAFSLPRFTKPVVKTGPATLDGIAYTRMTVDIGKQFPDWTIETFQLAGDTPAIRRVNAELYKVVPTDPQHADYFQCSMTEMAQGHWDGGQGSESRPEMLTKSFMVEVITEGDACGGIHPNYGVTHQTWDLRTGTAIDLYDDFNQAAVIRTVSDKGAKTEYTAVTFTPRLRAVVLAAYPKTGDDCPKAVDEMDDTAWDVRLTPKGMAFTMPATSSLYDPCTENDAVIPFDDFAPYLTDNGKALVAALEAEIKARK
ncbi:hypothetical protein [Asticcacaulis solisilvae]|uniref:hypothetical protein n=1 Tax=Asticcacaulis solisilvae TaxID=1217274 RepID=UPI003FD767DA